MEPETLATALIKLGAVFLASLAADLLGRRTRLPRITLLLLLGVCVGPLGFDLIPDGRTTWYPFVTDIALLMVAFLLGGELTLALLREHGRAVLVLSLAVVGATLVCVAAGLVALGWPATVALSLAAVAVATDPVAVSDVVRELRARGPFTKVLLGIVAIDDAWGIVTLSLLLAFILGIQSPEAARVATVEGLVDLGAAVLIGAALGVPMALLSGRIHAGDPTQAEALGGVLLCGGVALYFDVSFLLAAMTMGAVATNAAKHHRRPFHAIEGVKWPFMVLFFVLSGASLQLAGLRETATLATAYVVLRALGRLAGGWLGVRFLGRAPSAGGFGMALLPQAGIAIGMALVISERIPEVGGAVLAATITGTVFFELVGPILTRVAVVRSGEAREA